MVQILKLYLILYRIICRLISYPLKLYRFVFLDNTGNKTPNTVFFINLDPSYDQLWMILYFFLHFFLDYTKLQRKRICRVSFFFKSLKPICKAIEYILANFLQKKGPIRYFDFNSFLLLRFHNFPLFLKLLFFLNSFSPQVCVTSAFNKQCNVVLRVNIKPKRNKIIVAINSYLMILETIQ